MALLHAYAPPQIQRIVHVVPATSTGPDQALAMMRELLWGAFVAIAAIATLTLATIAIIQQRL